eukprot:9053341-Pyramimonas_sp.AAC.1
MAGCSFHARVNSAVTSFCASPNHLLCSVLTFTLMKHAWSKPPGPSVTRTRYSESALSSRPPVVGLKASIRGTGFLKAPTRQGKRQPP